MKGKARGLNPHIAMGQKRDHSLLSHRHLVQDHPILVLVSLGRPPLTYANCSKTGRQATPGAYQAISNYACVITLHDAERIQICMDPRSI